MRLEMDSNGSKHGLNVIRILIPELPSLWRRLRLRAFVLSLVSGWSVQVQNLGV